VDLTFKRPSSYKKRNSGKGDPGGSSNLQTEAAELGISNKAGKGSLSCKHCSSPVKSGWWLCPNCKKKL